MALYIICLWSYWLAQSGSAYSHCSFCEATSRSWFLKTRPHFGTTKCCKKINWNEDTTWLFYWCVWLAKLLQSICLICTIWQRGPRCRISWRGQICYKESVAAGTGHAGYGRNQQRQLQLNSILPNFPVKLSCMGPTKGIICQGKKEVGDNLDSEHLSSQVVVLTSPSNLSAYTLLWAIYQYCFCRNRKNK